MFLVFAIDLFENRRALPHRGDHQGGHLDERDRPDQVVAVIDEETIKPATLVELQRPASPPVGPLAEVKQPDHRPGRRHRPRRLIGVACVLDARDA